MTRRARCCAEIADRHRSVRQGLDRQQRRQARRPRHGSARPQPRRIRRQQEGQGRRPFRRDRVQAARHACNAPSVQSDVNRIVEAYRRAARDEVRVKPEIIDHGNGRVDLVYTITEGAKTPVRRSTSPETRPSATASSAQSSRPRPAPCSSFLTGGDTYDPDRVAQDQEQLRTLLSQQGLCRCQRGVGKGGYDPAQKGFALTFAIDEGPALPVRQHQRRLQLSGLDPEPLPAFPRSAPAAHV